MRVDSWKLLALAALLTAIAVTGTGASALAAPAADCGRSPTAQVRPDPFYGKAERDLCVWWSDPWYLKRLRDIDKEMDDELRPSSNGATITILLGKRAGRGVERSRAGSCRGLLQLIDRGYRSLLFDDPTDRPLAEINLNLSYADCRMLQWLRPAKAAKHSVFGHQLFGTADGLAAMPIGAWFPGCALELALGPGVDPSASPTELGFVQTPLQNQPLRKLLELPAPKTPNEPLFNLTYIYRLDPRTGKVVVEAEGIPNPKVKAAEEARPTTIAPRSFIVVRGIGDFDGDGWEDLILQVSPERKVRDGAAGYRSEDLGIHLVLVSRRAESEPFVIRSTDSAFCLDAARR